MDAAAVKFILAAIFSIFAIFPQLGYAESVAPLTYNQVCAARGLTGCNIPGGYSATSAQYWSPQHGQCVINYANGSGGAGSGLCGTVPGGQCPAGGYTFNTTTQMCDRPDCVSPQVRQTDGTCAAPNPCEAKSGQNVGSAISGTGVISGAACLTGACASVNGCAVGNCSQGTQSGTGAATKWVFSGCQYTGAAQTTTPANPVVPNQPTATPESCLASGRSYITGSSGTTTCIAPTDSPATQPTTTVTRGTNTTNGTTTTTTNETTCAGGNCSSNTTSTGGTTGTTGTTGSSATFCQLNPTNPICTGSGETKDPCEDNPDRLGCQTPEAPTEEAAIETTTKGVTSITVTPFASSAQCPANVALPKGATFKWEPICDLATGVKPILIALAWLTAGLIVMGAFKE